MTVGCDASEFELGQKMIDRQRYVFPTCAELQRDAAFERRDLCIRVRDGSFVTSTRLCTRSTTAYCGTPADAYAFSFGPRSTARELSATSTTQNTLAARVGGP